MTTFQKKVFEVVKKISEGKVLTYRQVAILAGRPRSFRAVGNILNRNYNRGIPCHRVIRSDREVGGYNRGARTKNALLKKEGVLVKKGKVIWL